MKKRLSPAEFDTFVKMQADSVVKINKRYGPGSKYSKRYHNGEHAIHVKNAVALMNRVAHTPSWERRLMDVGAVNHDLIHHFGIGSGWDERLSAMATRLAMRETGIFDRQDEEFVEELIIGTTVTLDGPNIYQKAADMGTPARRVADGDLFALGMPPKVYRPIAESLHYEHHPDQLLVGETLARFALYQVAVQEAHQYFTPEAKQCFPHKQENIDYMRHVASTAV